MTTSNTLSCDTSDIASVKACFPDGEAMVYGSRDYYYEGVYHALTRAGLSTYSYKLGIERPKHLRTRFWGRQIHQISSGQSEDANPPIRACKAGLVNMVLENYKSRKNGVPIVPVVFCIAAPGKQPLTPTNIVAKTIINPVISAKPIPNKIVTHCELRLAYNLCHGLGIYPEVQEIARASFRFVEVTPTGKGNCQLREVEAPWKSPEWDAAWAARKSSSTPTTNKGSDWRQQVNDFVHRQGRSSGPYGHSFVSRL